jgi:hypothetical protein
VRSLLVDILLGQEHVRVLLRESNVCVFVLCTCLEICGIPRSGYATSSGQYARAVAVANKIKRAYTSTLVLITYGDQIAPVNETMLYKYMGPLASPRNSTGAPEQSAQNSCHTTCRLLLSACANEQHWNVEWCDRTDARGVMQ